MSVVILSGLEAAKDLARGFPTIAVMTSVTMST